MNKYIYLGEDLGMGANKLYGAHGGVQVLSQVSMNGSQHLSESLTGGKKRRPMEVRSEHGAFYVGENAHDYGTPVENLDFDRLTGTPEIRSMFYAALTKYQLEHGLFDKPLSLMVGLPLQMLTGRDAKDFKNAVKRWMIGHHDWYADEGEFHVDVAEVALKAQAMGALFDYTYDHDGIVIPDPNKLRLWTEETAALSIGFNTIEFLLTRENDDIDRFTGGVTMGVRRLLEDINHQYENLYTLGELDMRLRLKRLDKDVMKRSLENWSQRVTGAIESRWGQYFKRFAAVLVVGGGAELLRPYIESKFRGKAIVLDEPVMSISHGLYKMALKFKKQA
jgi:plasmid segregation protein ParM